MGDSILELQKKLFQKLQLIAPYIGFIGGFIEAGVFEQTLVAVNLYPLGTFDFNLRCRDSPLPAILKCILAKTWNMLSETPQGVIEGSTDRTWVIVPNIVKDQWDDIVKMTQELQRIQGGNIEDDWQFVSGSDFQDQLNDVCMLIGQEGRKEPTVNNRRNTLFLSDYYPEAKDFVLLVQNLKEEGLVGGTSEQPAKIEQGATLIFSRQIDMDNFVEERDKLLEDLEERKTELMRQRYEEDVKLRKEFDEKLTHLIRTYQVAKKVSVRGRAPDMSRGEENQEDSSSRIRSELHKEA